MVARMLSALVVLHSVLIHGNCCRKNKEANKMGPSYHVHPNDTLPSDVQVTVWLAKGEGKRFFYTALADAGALSLTLSTCTSPILWSFAPNGTSSAPSFLTQAISTRHLPPSRGSFVLQLRPQSGDTFAFVYVSTEPGGPQALQKANFARVRLLKRQKGKRLTVKWNPSLVDPQSTNYCLVTTTAPFAGTLCAAQLAAPALDLACVGQKTHHTVSNLQQGQKYYFSVFATSGTSNFTYSYGSTSTTFNGRFRHISLKDGKATFANLKKLDGKAVFKFKVGESRDNASRSLDLFILPCGGVIDVEVTLRDVTVVAPKRVESFGRVTIEEPRPLERYYVKIFAQNGEELKKSSGVEIYATTRYPARVPLPNMPEVVKVTEFKSMATCDNVTIAWMPALSPKVVHYCITAQEGKIRETEEYPVPNQCGLESRLRKSTDFAVKYCVDLQYDKPGSVVHQTIRKLKPGRHYIVQVTAKKPKGRTLSYDLLQVRTKPSCKKKDK